MKIEDAIIEQNERQRIFSDKLKNKIRDISAKDLPDEIIKSLIEYNKSGGNKEVLTHYFKLDANN